MSFDQWLVNFIKDKKEVPSLDPSAYAIHTIRRFIDIKDCVWEIAFTYTGRLVVRSGKVDSDGITIKWAEWDTRHDVTLENERLR